MPAAAGGFASYLRVINTGTVTTAVSVAPIDAATGAMPQPERTARRGFWRLPCRAARSRPRLREAAGTMLEVRSYLLQPDGVFAEVSSGQATGE